MKDFFTTLWVIFVIICAAFLACLLWVSKWLVKPFYFWKKSTWHVSKKNGNKAKNTP